MTIVLLAACTPEPPAEPGLRVFDGTWHGHVTLESDGVLRDVSATFDAAVGFWGLLAVDDVDGVRGYEVIEADAVPPLGYSILFLERTGVRELTISILGEVPPIDGVWETRTYCDEPPDGWCREPGSVHLEEVLGP